MKKEKNVGENYQIRHDLFLVFVGVFFSFSFSFLFFFFFFLHIIFYVNWFGKSVLYIRIQYRLKVNVYR